MEVLAYMQMAYLCRTAELVVMHILFGLLFVDLPLLKTLSV